MQSNTPSTIDIPQDLYNQIIVSDALSLVQRLPDHSVPLYLFSPPYNLGNTTGGGMPGSKAANATTTGKWGGGKLADGYDDFGDNLPWPEYIAQQQTLLQECWRTLADNGAIYYNHKPRILDGVLFDPIRFIPPALPIRQRIIWARAGGINFSPSFYVPTHEYIYIIAKPAFRLKSKGASGAGDVWTVTQEIGTWHPAPFPLALAERVIETTMPAFVVDPYAGSGTTAVAAKRLGVGYIGGDRNAEYVTKARERIAAERRLTLRQATLVTVEVAQEALF